MIIRLATSGLSVGCAAALGILSAARADSLWTAVNELFPGPTTYSNTTVWSPYGTNYGGAGTTGLLRNVQSGEALGVSLAVTQSGADTGGSAAPPGTGTPAAGVFNGYVAWTGAPSGVNCIQLPGGALLTHTFSGLDPGKRYAFKGTGIRGSSSYSNRWIRAEIAGADAFRLGHTTNVLTAVHLPGQLTARQAAMLTGDNRSGDLVAWDEIDPGTDGVFSVACSQFTGTIPGRSTSGAYGYGLEAVRLDAYEPEAGVAIFSPVGGSEAAGTAVVVEASAWSSNGVTSVVFQVDGEPIGSDDTSPYAATWLDPALGPHVLTAVALDALGGALTSALVNVTVVPSPPQTITLVASNALYRWRPGTNEASSPVAAWRGTGFDDAAWNSGPAPFYYDDAPTTSSTYTGNTLLSGMRYNYSCVFVRHAFVVADPMEWTNLVIRHHVDDGFVAWLNGVEVCRVNMALWDGTSSDTADSNAPEPASYTYFNVTNPAPLVRGTNVLAVQCFNDSLTSSDLLLDLELTGARLSAGVLPPRVLSVDPPESVVYALSNLTVTFSEPVTNVQASDLVVGGMPAESVSGTGAVRTFAFPSPGLGDVDVTWATNQAIRDMDFPARPFDPTGTVWHYRLADTNAPAILAVDPPAGASLTNLTRIEVRFSRAVTNVDAADLLLDGVPAVGVSGSNDLYAFDVATLDFGTVPITWSPAHGITDLEDPPHPFDANVPESRWSYTLLDLTPPPQTMTLVASNALYRWRPGTNEASVPATAWRLPGFNDSSWDSGQAPFYYDNAPSTSSTYTGNTLVPGMEDNYMCVFVRHAFVVADPIEWTNLVIRHHVDDGFVAWLNGIEICRVNMALWNGDFDGAADDNAPEPASYTYFNVTNPPPLLRGTNVLAVQCFNDSLSSSDLLLDLELTGGCLHEAALPPRVLAVDPPEGVVYALTNLAVTFTEPVTNVQAGDLLIAGVPADSVAGTGAVRTFAFPSPGLGPVTVTWATNQAIWDLDLQPRPFDPAGAGFQYHLADSNAPVIAAQDPPAGAALTNLAQIEVRFSKPVTGVDATDLLVAGVPATGVTGSNDVYTFEVPTPPYGSAEVAWTAGHGIEDLDSPPHPFDAALPSSSWSYAMLDRVPPIIVAQAPAAGTFVSNLSELAVFFSEPVAGLNAADLLINGRPAAHVSGTGAVYTFTFAPPNAATAAVSWAAGHGIADLAAVPNAFERGAPGATWSYATRDTIPPSVATLLPPAGARVRALTSIRVTFDEPVAGVTAGDLLVNGEPAFRVTGAGSGPYVFEIAPAASGTVSAAWAPGQAIQDLAVPPHAFTDGAWTYSIDPSLRCEIAVSNVLHISVDGLGGFYLRDYVSNAPALFPNFARLCREGAFTFDARCDYSSSVTLPNHTCMLTGRPMSQPSGWSNTAHHGITFDSDNGGTIHDSGNPNLSYQASVLDVAHDHGRSTAFYSSKTKFAFYVRSYDASHGAPDVMGIDDGADKVDVAMLTDGSASLYGASESLVDALVVALSGTPANYTFMHFADPDYAGHSGGWGGTLYSNAVRHVDQQLGRLLAAIDANPALANQVAVILTADHGGGGNSSTGHSTTSRYKNYAVPLFVWSPGFTGGANLYRHVVNRGDPGTNYLDYTALPQPLRNGDSGNLALALLGLPPIPGSTIQPVLGTQPVDPWIAHSATGPVVSWPLDSEGFGLEATLLLHAPFVNWQPMTNGILTNASQRYYPLPAAAPGPTYFFRLRKP